MKTATGSFFVIPALLGLTVTQAQTVQTVKEPVLMSIIWTRRLNLLTTFPICKRNMVRQY
jgi:hypothetical protein